LYLFDNAHEGLAMHRHNQLTAHNVEVLGGSVMIYGLRGVNKIVAHVGDVVEIEWDRWHEIRALVDHTVIFNRYLNGMPADYAGLPDSDMWSNSVPILLHSLSEDGTPTLLPEFEEIYQ
jgi:DNA-binding PucR family transcriptional regulator